MVNNTDKMFEKGKAFLAENNTLAALSCFEKAYSDGASPEIKSYLGLCLALERGQIRDGIALCRQAIAEETGNPVHYLHLARIYLKEKRKDEAIEILRTGLSFGDNEQSREIRHVYLASLLSSQRQRKFSVSKYPAHNFRGIIEQG
jgi:tetratricopeptide (TPR) repeat protein